MTERLESILNRSQPTEQETGDSRNQQQSSTNDI
jgi:hypothetical protein